MPKKETQRKNNLKPKNVNRYSIVDEPEGNYLPQSELERVKQKTGFNGLTPSEWALLSKNVLSEDEFNQVWNDLSSPRNQYQLEHGAVYPVKLAERLIKMYSREGDTVFDPFLGIGSTLVAAQSLQRNGIGIELNPKFVKVAEAWLQESRGLFCTDVKISIVNDDCRNLKKHFRSAGVQVTITSPPYANFIQRSVSDRSTVHKKSVIANENNSTVKPYSDDLRDFGNLPYKEFLAQLKDVLMANYDVTKKGGYSAWVVKDYRDTKNNIPYVPFHSDLAKIGQECGFKFHDLIVWDQTGQRRLVLLGYPTVIYTNQNCSFIVVFRKI